MFFYETLEEARANRKTGEVTKFDFVYGYYNERKIKFLLKNKGDK
jgi:hypothetical protein